MSGKGATKKHKMPIIAKFDVKEGKMEDACTQAGEDESPMLYLFYRKGKFDNAFVTADSSLFYLEPVKIGVAMIRYLSIFYIFNVGYPKSHAQILGFLQRIYLGDDFTDKKSDNHVQLLAEFDTQLKDVKLSKMAKKLAV